MNITGNRVLALLARVIRLLITLSAIPLGFVGLVEGALSLYGDYMNNAPQVSTYSLGLLAFGGIVILAAVIVILFLIAIEEWSYARVRDGEITARGRGSINRLLAWIPKESEQVK